MRLTVFEQLLAPRALMASKASRSFRVHLPNDRVFHQLQMQPGGLLPHHIVHSVPCEPDESNFWHHSHRLGNFIRTQIQHHCSFADTLLQNIGGGFLAFERNSTEAERPLTDLEQSEGIFLPLLDMHLHVQQVRRKLTSQRSIQRRMECLQRSTATNKR